jgi:glucose/arabinose dehydrogenase
VNVRLVKIATLEQPVAFAVRKGDQAFYVAEKTGKVMAIRNGRVDAAPVLDLSGQVSLGGEQGLLGLAFSPDGRYLYVNYTDLNGDTRVIEYVMKGGRADTDSRRQVLFVHQPFTNHNGGDLVFGPDGYLYIGLGDGGSEGDPMNEGQRLDTLLAKMLRIDPRPSGGQPYGIPRDNPFVGHAGARPEIWAYGLRNPWRYRFDRQTDDLWIGDVGQNMWEEIDFQPAGSKGGENYGWNRMEGNHPYSGRATSSMIRPVYEYSHQGGACAVVGGYVYRGSRIPALRGAYLLGDDCVGPIVALAAVNGRVVQRRTLPISVQSLSSFGEDQNGELYALSLSGPVYRIDP